MYSTIPSSFVIELLDRILSTASSGVREDATASSIMHISANGNIPCKWFSISLVLMVEVWWVDVEELGFFPYLLKDKVAMCFFMNNGFN